MITLSIIILTTPLFNKHIKNLVDNPTPSTSSSLSPTFPLSIIVTPTSKQETSFYRIKPDPLGELYDDEVLGKVQQYKHDITGIVQYNRVSVDDDIAKVEVICSDKVTDVTSKFSRIVAPPEDGFPNYGSQPIEIPKTCSIIFTVRDLKSNSTGLTLYGIIK